MVKTSLPSRECGLKFLVISNPASPFCVTPFAGVWIEIDAYAENGSENMVTPFAGVWIEITAVVDKRKESPSLPSRECGLKYDCQDTGSIFLRHSLRGSVD